MTQYLSKRRRAAALVADGCRCVVCGAQEGLSVHHLTPRALGGTHAAENLVTICERCHMRIEHGALVLVRVVARPLLVLLRRLRPLRWPEDTAQVQRLTERWLTRRPAA